MHARAIKSARCRAKIDRLILSAILTRVYRRSCCNLVLVSFIETTFRIVTQRGVALRLHLFTAPQLQQRRNERSNVPADAFARLAISDSIYIYIYDADCGKTDFANVILAYDRRVA